MNNIITQNGKNRQLRIKYKSSFKILCNLRNVNKISSHKNSFSFYFFKRKPA